MPRSTALVKQGAAEAPPKQTLIDIADTIAEVSELLATAETEDEFKAAAVVFDQCLANDLANKVDGIGYHERMEKASIEALKEIIKVAQARIKAIETAKQRMRDRILYAMTKMNTDMIKGRLTCITLMDGKESLDVYNEDSIPNGYFEERTVYVLDKDRLKRDLEAGVEINGARLKTGADYLQIK